RTASANSTVATSSIGVGFKAGPVSGTGGNATAWARPGGRPATKVENLPARSGGTATGVPAPVTRVRALAPAVSGACRVPMAATPGAPRADAAGGIGTDRAGRAPRAAPAAGGAGDPDRAGHHR